MHKYRKFIKQAFEELASQRIIKTVEKLNQYYDEPKIHYYSARKFSKSGESATGLSFESPELALLRCAGEAVERNVLLDISHQKLRRSAYDELKKEGALDPNTLNENLLDISNTPLSWIRGYEGTDTNKPIWIPAQTVFLSNIFRKNEPFLLPSITTGAAGGFDHESTLLRALYEAVERDSFMCVYLTKSKPRKIRLNSIRSKKIQNIISYLSRYQLKPHLFDITSDTQIPAYLVVLMDHSGLGPQFTISSKADINIEGVICGALEESMLTRQWIRKIVTKQFPLPVKIQKKLIGFDDRAKYWLPKHMIKHLDFLLTIPETTHTPIIKKPQSFSLELKAAAAYLKNAGYSLFFCPIDHSLCRTLDYLVYKAVIPGLQPLYIHEDTSVHFKKRLQKASQFFGKKNYLLNTVPHPFL